MNRSHAKLLMFALAMAGVTAILVMLARHHSALWYFLAAPAGFVAMMSTFVWSGLWLTEGEGVRRALVFHLVWLSATVIFAFLGQRGTPAWYLLAVPCGLFTALCVALSIAVLTRDPTAHARRKAKLYEAGWRPCPGCKELRAPPIDPTRCHGCGKPLDHATSMCVCTTCYTGHLTSN
jgi:hypothetical protein